MSRPNFPIPSRHTSQRLAIAHIGEIVPTLRTSAATNDRSLICGARRTALAEVKRGAFHGRRYGEGPSAGRTAGPAERADGSEERANWSNGTTTAAEKGRTRTE